MTAEPTETRPTAAWMKVLNQIEDTLARQMASVEEPAPSGAATPPTKKPLHALDASLAQMQARVDQAERRAEETDAALRTDAEAYQRWTESMTATRRRLGDWAGRVG
jgi:hypothetical protein